jgi:class 3 adenylate cyclase
MGHNHAMQAPPVQYCTTNDGVRIAFTVSGSGPPLVFVTENVVSHVQLEWSQPVFGALFQRLAGRLMLVRFDRQGTGLSDRSITADPTEAGLREIDAVVGRIGLSRFALAAVQTSSFTAIRYAAEHPDQVSRLALADGMVRAADLIGTPQGQALAAALAADYLLGTEAIGAAAFGAGREESRDYGAYIRQCVGPNFFEGIPDFVQADVGELLPAITQPTLVLKHAGVLYVSTDAAKELPSRIPDARLAVVDGGWADDIVGVADRLADFVLEDAPAAPAAPTARPEQSGVRTILFTDIEGHTQMMQRLGDTRGRDVLREHERITRETLRVHGGFEVKSMGDGFMASFGSVTAAAECAVVLQRAFAEHATGGAEPIAVRIGLNAGEPVAEDGDLFGSSVILAARIAGQAAGREILVSDVVRGLLAGKGFLFADRGDTALRGFEDPVRLYELRWQDA